MLFILKSDASAVPLGSSIFPDPSAAVVDQRNTRSPAEPGYELYMTIGAGEFDAGYAASLIVSEVGGSLEIVIHEAQWCNTNNLYTYNRSLDLPRQGDASQPYFSTNFGLFRTYSSGRSVLSDRIGNIISTGFAANCANRNLVLNITFDDSMRNPDFGNKFVILFIGAEGTTNPSYTARPAAAENSFRIFLIGNALAYPVPENLEVGGLGGFFNLSNRNRPTNSTAGYKIDFVAPCGLSAAAAVSIQFYDADNGNYQNANGYPALTYTFIENGLPIQSGNVSGGDGENSAVYGSFIRRNNSYQFVIDGLSYINAIGYRANVPISVFDAEDNCDTAIPTCQISNIRNRFSGSSVIRPGDQVSFDVRTTNAAGYILGVNGSSYGAEYGSTDIDNYITNIPGNFFARGSPAGSPAGSMTIPSDNHAFAVDDIVLNVDDNPGSPVAIVAPSASGTYAFNWGLVLAGTGWKNITCTASLTVRGNQAPSGTIYPNCTIQPGTTRATIAGRVDLVDEDGDNLTINLNFPNSGSQNSSRIGGGSITINSFDVDRRVGDYTITGTVSDGTVTVDLTSGSTPCPPPAPPTISTRGDVSCTTYNYAIADNEDGFRYTAQLQVSNDGGTTWNNASPAISSGNLAEGDHSFNQLAEWRDFNSRRFRIVVTNNLFSSVGSSTQSGNIGPCLRMTCGGVNATGVIEVNRPFSLTVNFITRQNYGDNTQLATIGSRGSSVTYGVTATTTNPPLTPSNPLPTGQTITSASNSTLSHTIGVYTAPATPYEMRVTYALTSANANAAASCPGGGNTTLVDISALPYIQSFRGDIIAGYGMSTTPGQCSTDTAGGVRGYTGSALTNSTQVVGAGTQTSVYTLGNVTGFRSGIMSPTSNSRPWWLTFANTSPPRGTSATGLVSTDILGGQFSSALCAENWFSDLPTASQNAPATLDVTTVNGVVRYNGNVTLTASRAIERNRKIFVDGNVIINSQMSYDTDWNNVYEVPSLIIVATGNIYIDDDVTSLDGTFVAYGQDPATQGAIFTCVDSAAVLPSPTTTISAAANPATYRPGGKCYTNPLNVNGAIVAARVKLWRTGGTISKQLNGAGAAIDATGVQSYNPRLTGAETIRVVPDLFVAPRFGEGSTNGDAGKKQLDSLISLPPIF